MQRFEKTKRIGRKKDGQTGGIMLGHTETIETEDTILAKAVR